MADAGNIESVRRFVEAFNRLDRQMMVGELHPDVELSEWPAAPGPQTYHGHEGALRALSEWFETWEWMRVEILDAVEVEDRVLVTLHQRAKGRGSEVEVEIKSYNVHTFRGGRQVRIQLFTEPEPALEAAGLPSHQADAAGREATRDTNRDTRNRETAEQEVG